VSGLSAYIINHTHWDREWFLTSEYTNRWIGGLIDKIAQLVEENPEFQYFLDGQTLVIEDLLQVDAGYQRIVERLVGDGNLLIGPYYCQPDWRLASGESLLRNLLYGLQDMQKYAVHSQVGWLVDTFGHISQAPQLHRLFDIPAVYIWRGAPRLEPYFHWKGPDGSMLFTVNLFGGYRNLYGITRTPRIAVARLSAELEKLRPYYPTPDIPLFDGYDLENDPEDPLKFYLGLEDQLPQGVHLEATTPAGFAERMHARLDEVPVLSGELNSGKYGSVFPGSLSTRTYLKIMHSDCENLLYRVCEPLAVLARGAGRSYPSQQYEIWSRALLRNAVHDCICGVSIDLVHEKMEDSYRLLFDEMTVDLHQSLAHVLGSYPPGMYCVSTNPFHYSGWQMSGEHLYPLKVEGIGIWPAGEAIPVRTENRAVEAFTWQNEHYKAQVQQDGRVKIGDAVLGALVAYEEHGDTYSEESGQLLGALQPQGALVVEQESELHAVLHQSFSLSWRDAKVSALLHLTFDQSSLIRWQVMLDGRGVDYRVEMVFETGLKGQVYAGMPFDKVSRPTGDRDLLPRQLQGKLAEILIGQRDLREVRSFPFHEYVILSDSTATRALFAKGLRAYQAGEGGRLSVPLLRSVEWLTKPDLPSRVGDAGPAFYVPDARCERTVTHELAFACLERELSEVELLALNSGFQNQPLLVEREGLLEIDSPAGEGHRSHRSEPLGRHMLHEEVPISSLHFYNDKVLARMYNPGESPLALSKSYRETDVSGKSLGWVDSLAPKRIMTLELPAPKEAKNRAAPAVVKIWNAPALRVGANQGLPDPAVMDQLKEAIERLDGEIIAAVAKAQDISSGDTYYWQHRVYVLRREQLEYRLSLRLNEIKLDMGGMVSREYLYQRDEQVAEIGYQLNQMRIQRRIYDYVVQMKLDP
jgi:alpha-mannosidase